MRKTKTLFGIICFVLIGLASGNAGTVDRTPNDDVRIELQSQVADVYTSQVGVRELTGHNDGVAVEKYLAVTGFEKGNSWCAAFVSWTFQEARVTALKNAWAPSWFPTSKTIYAKGKHNTLKPDKADVFGIYYEAKKRIGHVGFIDEWPASGDYAITVEGNTNSAGRREGDGVYRKRRLKANIFKVSRWVDPELKVDSKKLKA